MVVITLKISLREAKEQLAVFDEIADAPTIHEDWRSAAERVGHFYSELLQTLENPDNASVVIELAE